MISQSSKPSCFISPPGSPPSSSCEPTDCPQQEEAMMKRWSDDYLPVPDEEKNPDGSFSRKAGNESIVRGFLLLALSCVNSFPTLLEAQRRRFFLCASWRCKVLIFSKWNQNLCSAANREDRVISKHSDAPLRAVQLFFNKMLFFFFCWELIEDHSWVLCLSALMRTELFVSLPLKRNKQCFHESYSSSLGASLTY